MAEECIRIGLASGEREVREALNALRMRLEERGLAPADCGTVEIVLGEVLNNIVEHAYGPRRAGRIDIGCVVGAERLTFRVSDSGRPMPGFCLPEGALPDARVARTAAPEGGFGWFLVRSLTSGLKYRREAERNLLEFEIARRSVSGPHDKDRDGAQNL